MGNWSLWTQQWRVEDRISYDFADLHFSCQPGQDIIHAGNFKVLAEAARRFRMPEVQSACDTFCCKNLEISNSSVPELLEFAIDYDLPALRELCGARINSAEILGIVYGVGGEHSLSNLPGPVAAKLLTAAADVLRKTTELSIQKVACPRTSAAILWPGPVCFSIYNSCSVSWHFPFLSLLQSPGHYWSVWGLGFVFEVCCRFRGESH